MIARQGDLESKKNFAKIIAKLDENQNHENQ